MNDNADEDREIPGLKRIVSSLPVDHSGTFVYLRGWRAEESRWPPLIFVHDLGEQADQYAQTAEALVARGYTCYAFDLRGHGRSGRLLGHLTRFDVLVKDLLQVAAWVKHKEAGQAPIVIGQGVGALITAEFAHHFGNFCGGIVLASPCFQLTKEPYFPLRFFFKLVSDVIPTWRPPRLLAPNFTKILAPSLKLTSASIDAILSAMKRSESSLRSCAVNALILCPEHDSISSYQSLKKTVALHSNQSLKTVDLGGVSRALFTSTPENRQSALSEITAWLEPLSSRTAKTTLVRSKDSHHLVPLSDTSDRPTTLKATPFATVPKD